MANHYHLLVETPDGNLSKGIRQLNGVYTQRFNRIYERVGHVLQGRYRAILVEKDAYLLELVRYLALNPVRAGMVRVAGDWPGSSYGATGSYGATAGEVESPDWLRTTWLLSTLAPTQQEAVDRYRRFVSAGMSQPSPWTQLKHQVFLGSEASAEAMQRRLPSQGDLTEITRAQRRPRAPTLLQYAQEFPTRDAAIAAAYASGAYRAPE